MTASMVETILALESAMASTGEIANLVVGEPKNAPQNQTLAIIMDDAETGDLNLATANEFRHFILRYYSRSFEDERATELDTARVYDVIRSTLGGDVDLSTFGGPGEGVIEAWQAGITMNPGFLTIDNTVFRIMDVRVPLWVCDVALAR